MADHHTLVITIVAEIPTDAMDYTDPENPIPAAELVREWGMNYASDLRVDADRWFNGTATQLADQPEFVGDIRPRVRVRTGYTVAEALHITMPKETV